MCMLFAWRQHLTHLVTLATLPLVTLQMATEEECVLAVFHTPLDAAECALELQVRLQVTC